MCPLHPDVAKFGRGAERDRKLHLGAKFSFEKKRGFEIDLHRQPRK